MCKMASVCGETIVKFVGYKVSRVRWCPVPQGQLTPSDTFVTGGWDDTVNKLGVWRVSEGSPENASTLHLPYEPNLLCETAQAGDVTDIQFLDPRTITTASSNGSVYLYTCGPNHKSIEVENVWPGLHHAGNKGCSCTSLATNPTLSEMISVGEDGRINVIRAEQRHPARIIDSADSTTIWDVVYTKSSEVVTVSCSGQLKVWDLRQAGNKPTITMLLSGDRVPLLSVDKHPTQSHLLAAGGQDGVVSIWDLRQKLYPVTLMEAHEAGIWEIKFHFRNPDNLFTCSEDGSLWHWDGTSLGMSRETGHQFGAPGSLPGAVPNGTSVGVGLDGTSPWLSVDATKHKLETYSLLPHNRLSVNSLDIESKHLLGGSDCEAVFLIRDLVIK